MTALFLWSHNGSALATLLKRGSHLFLPLPQAHLDLSLPGDFLKIASWSLYYQIAACGKSYCKSNNSCTESGNEFNNKSKAAMRGKKSVKYITKDLNEWKDGPCT